MTERIQTPMVKGVMQLAFQEADRLNDPYVDTGHILLALLKNGEGIACQLLKDAGFDLRKIRDLSDKMRKEKAESRESSLCRIVSKDGTEYVIDGAMYRFGFEGPKK